MLRIYYAYVSGLDPAGDYALSEYRRARLESVRPDASRRCGIGAELLLNRAITDWRSDFPLPLDIVTLEHGKPALRGGEVYIGLSHSGAYAAAAVCDEDFGLDIQRSMPPNIALARRFFAEVLLQWDVNQHPHQHESGQHPQHSGRLTRLNFH